MGFKFGFGGLLVLFALSLSEAQQASWQMPTWQQTPQQFSHDEPVQAPQEPQHGKPVQQEAPKRQRPMQKPVQEPVDFQSKQVLQGPVKELAWRFPMAPVEAEKPEVAFELKTPLPANTVAVRCGENVVQVEVKKDLFGINQPIQPSALTLGDCAAAGEDAATQTLIFESELQACGSVLTMTEDGLIYSFTLVYAPEALSGTPVVRTGDAVVGIECHYARRADVSSDALRPTWIPYAATKIAEELLVFSLRLMTDDWQFERPSNQYFLGDLIHIEAVVMQYMHVPLRVFVDSCVATTAPDVNSVPSYTFIDNHGCMVDAKITGSDSRFLNRIQDDKLQFQLEAFRFQQDSGLIYITCFLKATAASSPTDAEHKACSFSPNGWTAADRDDQVCGCCDSGCGFRKGRDLEADAALEWEGEASLSLVVKENPLAG
ncbi:zona pellucida sperm-binding protein 3-like [Chanos chanos]|uniref:Zona pellucida sperm-binding protein 3 n=1 Tax=Chanos chanos TaxID=29144 RepID=A0A6J2WXY4_CHACN|nr:zona pellucida sperm-binding protein 3-like [Chanos chanos]